MREESLAKCSHQWRGRGVNARCVRCGILKTQFKREEHERKMEQKAGSA